MASDKSREPSMEDLLASIREIIADDVRQTKPAKASAKEEKVAPLKATPPAPEVLAKKQDDVVLELVNKIDAPQKMAPSLLEDDRVRTRLRAETTFDPEQVAMDKIEDYLGPASPHQETKLAYAKPSFRADLDQFVQERVVQATQDKDLLDPETVKQTAKALEGLNSVIETTRTETQSTGLGSKTVEDLMKEILKPLLKTWLDAHLPSLVKWVVAEQVEKILQSRHRN